MTLTGAMSNNFDFGSILTLLPPYPYVRIEYTLE
jgi:hypothetical protein